jgi:tRNA (guanine37-N1)-methyltransferase
LPQNLLIALPRALDIVGDIAIIEIPSEIEAYKHVIGEAILKTHRNVRTVLAKAGVVSGTYRLRDFEFIVGEHRTDTLYKEHGCNYYVDVAKAYFSPRLSHEHKRVASITQKGETVADLFAGVGPFAVLIAKKHPDVKVYGIDINADAIELLEKNARLNRVENRVYPIVGDAHQVVDERLCGVADRVIMNLPETASKFIDTACKAVKSTGGTVHFYSFLRTPHTIDDMKNRFTDAVEKAGKKVEVFSYAKTIRETAPHQYQAVLDAQIL